MIAIVIPFYKVVFFDETLNSLANQIDKRFKVYIGDDASPDDCTYLINNYADKLDISYKRFDTNIGADNLSKHWERCIDLIDDDSINWILILGDDDILDQHVIQSFFNNIDNFNDTNIVRFSSQLINEISTPESVIYKHPIIENPNSLFFRKLQGNTRSSLSEYVFKKSAFLKYKFTNYPLAWHTDDKAWLDFSENKSIFSINSAVVKVRMSKYNISGDSNSFITNKKKSATIQFYHDVLNSYFNTFTYFQKIEFLIIFEDFLKKSSIIKFNDWYIIFKKYISIFDLVSIIKLLKRFVTFSIRSRH
jgi:glycosyltransferase involved in cell wall biosynthesis